MTHRKALVWLAVFVALGGLTLLYPDWYSLVGLAAGFLLIGAFCPHFNVLGGSCGTNEEIMVRVFFAAAILAVVVFLLYRAFKKR